MPAEAAVTDEDFDATAEIGARPERAARRRIVLVAILALVLLVGAGAGVVLSGIFDPFGLSAGDAVDDGAAQESPDPASLVFFDLPDLLVNLNSSGKRPSYLKMRVSLEVEDASAIPILEKLTPRIIDSFQMYLRELRIDDLRGSAGLARLREELLRRVNASVAPVVIRDVLFREMLVQ